MPKKTHPSLETAGSLTPQLEGAPHSAAHTPRSAPPLSPLPTRKEGARHA